MENIIELKNVYKTYEDDGFTAVSDFNLEVKRGEFVTFLGPSGCGKTTTLRMIAGFDLPTSGEILLNGKSITNLPPNKRPINTVFQRYALFPHMNIYENIAFGLKQKKVSREVIDKKVKKVLALVDLEGFEERSVATLSGGQQQRVAIARAVVNEPEILLLDEPLGALDLKMRKEMQLELKAMHKELGITFIYVTHDQEEALTMSDKIVVMSNGHIQQVGTPAEVFDMPKNLFVAEFIGAPKMNIMETRLSREGGQWVVSPFGVKIPVEGEKGEALDKAYASEQDILLGIRPEHISLHFEEGPGRIPCFLEVKEMMGSELHLHVTAGEGQRLIVRIPTLGLSEEEKKTLEQGRQLYLGFESKAMHFFGKESENNLL